MTQKLKVRIDGEFVAASPGQSVLQVARAGNKYIPALCYMEGLSALGSCRLCMVEVQGVSRLLPACTTPVQVIISCVTFTLNPVIFHIENTISTSPVTIT